MCPAAERQKRLNENDVHKLEIPHPTMTPGRSDYAQTMVKKFQRSSADHALQIPHLLRTPEALLRSIGELNCSSCCDCCVMLPIVVAWGLLWWAGAVNICSIFFEIFASLSVSPHVVFVPVSHPLLSQCRVH
jgi:hypothetical protein